MKTGAPEAPLLLAGCFFASESEFEWEMEIQYMKGLRIHENYSPILFRWLHACVHVHAGPFIPFDRSTT